MGQRRHLTEKYQREYLGFKRTRRITYTNSKDHGKCVDKPGIIGVLKSRRINWAARVRRVKHRVVNNGRLVWKPNVTLDLENAGVGNASEKTLSS